MLGEVGQRKFWGGALDVELKIKSLHFSSFVAANCAANIHEFSLETHSFSLHSILLLIGGIV